MLEKKRRQEQFDLRGRNNTKWENEKKIFKLKKGFTFIIRVNKSRRRIWVTMSHIRETWDTVTIFSTESLTVSKYLGVINSTDETGKKLVKITSAPKVSKWARGPTILDMFLHLSQASFFVDCKY